MWRLLVALGLLAGLGVGSAPAQQWSGTAAVDVAGGYQTNLYLDPVLGTWNANVTPALAALTPRLGLSRSTSRTRLDATVQSRLHPRRTDVPQRTQGSLRFRYHLTSEWTLGATAGGTRYRFTTTSTNVRTNRDSWWLLPSLQWTPTSETMVTFHTGLTQRFERFSEQTDRQTSRLASLRTTHWLTARVRGEARLYVSNGRTSLAESGFGGSGGRLSATYWPTNAVSVRGTMGVEQFRYETGAGTTRDWIGQAGGEVEWSPRSTVTLFGRAKALYAALDQGDSGTTDLHVSGGVRLQLQRALGGTADPPPQRRVCHNTDDGLQIRVPYDGEGTVHVTGDFNNWSLPGVPLEPGEGDQWQTTLDLPSGRYTYRFRVVEEDEARWIDLPSYAQTTQDSFGSTNGVCTVP